MKRREQLIARAREGFRMAYGIDPTRIYSAPGRVNLIGEHTDYNAGLVLPCAIDRETIIVLGPSDESDKIPQIQSIALDMGSVEDAFQIKPEIERAGNNWQNHIRGVAHYLQQRGVPLKPARIAIAGDIPIGSGLSSSASLGVVAALALSDHAGLPLQPADLASVAQKSENDYVGCACGIMDQMASAAGAEGHALLLDCRSLEHMPIPIARDLEIVVIDSGIRRQLTESAFNTRREECDKAAAHYGMASLRTVTHDQLEQDRGALDDALFRRARHVVNEIARVEPMAVALVQGQTAQLSELMRASHNSLRDDFEVSVPEVDRLVAIVDQAIGDAGGVRMTGAGFGGSVVAIVAKDRVDLVFDAVSQGYNPKAEFPGTVQIFKPSTGAARIK